MGKRHAIRTHGPLKYWPAWLSQGVRPRIALSFGLLGLVCLLALGWVASRAAHLEAHRHAEATLTQAASALAQQLDNDMSERLADVTAMAQWWAVHLDEQRLGGWREALEQLQQAMPDYSWIGLCQPNGQVMVATQRLLEGQSVAARPWFQQGLHGPVALSVHEAKLLARLLPSHDGEPLRLVDVAAPVRVDGRTVAVLGAHLNWQWARQRSQLLRGTFAASQGLQVWILDPQGQVLLGDPQLWRAMLGASLSDAPVTHTLGDGQAWLVTSQPSKPMGAYPGMGWRVVVAQPLPIALAAAEWVQRVLLALGLAGALVFAAASWWLAGSLTAPLRRAAEVAQQVAAIAEPAPGAEPRSRDEVTQLSQSIRTLAQHLGEREAALARLQSSVDEALDARMAGIHQQNAELRDFRRTVSHDLRGPLGQMALLLQQVMLREGAQVPAGMRRSVELVAAECARLSQLTDDLLKLAMAEERPMQLQPVDHRQLIAQELQRLQAGAKSPSVAVHVGEVPLTVGDPSLLRQVWANLLSNAFKFSGRSAAPKVEIEAHVEGNEGVFTVSDNGVGFDAERAEQLFQAFQRLPGAEGFEGAGVGLTIVQRIVQRHGGQIWADGAPGQGARFHFRLPLRHLAGMPTPTPAPTGSTVA